jgi:hypothetical protein
MAGKIISIFETYRMVGCALILFTAFPPLPPNPYLLPSTKAGAGFIFQGNYSGELFNPIPRALPQGLSY